MALIKCEECGKEVSDKAKSCIHCGCPIETKEKTKCGECGNEVSKGQEICPNCGCPVECKIEEPKTNTSYYSQELVIDKLKINYAKIEKWQTIFVILGILFTLSLIGAPVGITLLVLAFCYGSCKRNDIILTNKRIKGSIGWFGKTETVDIPLDKIDSITMSHDWLKIEKLIISSNAKLKGVMFSLDTEKFCENTLKEIEKYKKYMYRREG